MNQRDAVCYMQICTVAMTYSNTKTVKPHLSFQSVLGQRDNFADVGPLITLPPTNQLDLGAVEEGIAHCCAILSNLAQIEDTKEPTHEIVIVAFRDRDSVAIDGMASLRVTQHTGVVDKWCRSFICRTMELYQHPLDVKQGAMYGI